MFINRCTNVTLRSLPEEANFNNSPAFAYLHLNIVDCEFQMDEHAVQMSSILIRNTQRLSFKMPHRAPRDTIHNLFKDFKGILEINQTDNSFVHVYTNSICICPRICLNFTPNSRLLNKVAESQPREIILSDVVGEIDLFEALWNNKRRATIIHRDCLYTPDRMFNIKNTPLLKTRNLASFFVLQIGDSDWSQSKITVLTHPNFTTMLKDFLF